MEITRGARPLRSAVGLALSAVITLTGVGCASHGNTHTAVDDCSAYQDPYSRAPSGVAPSLQVIAVDVPDNGEGMEQTVLDVTKPIMADALEHGAFVHLLTSGGVDQEIRTSPCMAGINGSQFLIASGSRAHDRADWTDKGDELAVIAGAFTREQPVSPHGSLTRVLAVVGGVVRDARASGKVGDIDVTVVTNLLGNTTAEDCLSMDNMTFRPDIAEKIVDRCFTSGQVGAFDGIHSLRFAGVGGYARTTNQVLLAESVAEALGPRLSPMFRQGAQ
ncbi:MULTISPECIES: hypothetical protein [Pseudofrankia]|uniref:hypothetical protein n=1 Tax=Pseudofrankia TaxID=2994363 RepID=UPI000234B6AF|nr:MULTISPECIES: hypothetical protein [Pseudofrankia]OHV35965.1 hypothetical protein BCD49_20320 [Pseudofrankia sp. EUN1h]